MLSSKPEQHQTRRPGEVVVLIHGIFMPGVVMRVLARRLHRAGWATIIFSYSSRRMTPQQNSAALAAMLGKVEFPVVHFVAHSLGGLVLMHFFQAFSLPSPGRVVLLGTPFQGSFVARRLSRHAWGRWLCGQALQGGLLGEGPQWAGERELGVIGGTRPFGAGWVTPGLSHPHDGTVAVNETQVPGQTDSILLPVTHSGLLFSKAVAQQVVTFLGAGRFSH